MLHVVKFGRYVIVHAIIFFCHVSLNVRIKRITLRAWATCVIIKYNREIKINLFETFQTKNKFIVNVNGGVAVVSYTAMVGD